MIYFIIKFSAAEETVNRVERQPTEWEKILANLTSDNRFRSTVFKELLRLTIKNPQIFRLTNRQKTWLDFFPPKSRCTNGQQAHEKMLNILISREMQIQTTVRYQLAAPTEMATVKNKTKQNQVLARMWRNGKPRALLARMLECCSCYGKQCRDSSEIKNRTAIWSRKSLFGYLSKRAENRF